MSSPYVGKKIIQLDTVDSTNNYAAKEFKQGHIQSGTVILAGEQTFGRGQRGKLWQSSPHENILMSFPLDLTFFGNLNPITVNHLVSLALYDFFISLDLNAAIKWPNDILINNKKIAGILIENQLEGKTFVSSIIGIGINVNQLYFDFPKTTSLYIELRKSQDLKVVLGKIISCINKRLEDSLHLNEYDIRRQYTYNLWKINELTGFVTNGNEIKGTIISTESDGGIIIESEGKKMKYYNGEIQFKERL